MFQRVAKCVASVLAAGLLVGVAVAASEAPFKEKGVGTVTDLAPGHIAFSGIGVASHLGKYAEVGSNDFDDQGNVGNGVFSISAADGSTLSGTYWGTYAPLPTGAIQFNLNVSYLVGTGRLTGVTGQSQVVAVLGNLAPGSKFQYQGIGSLLLP